MGTPDFAVPALNALMASNHAVKAVYCQPPKPKGRGYKIQLTPVHQVAEQAGIPVFTPKNFRQDSQALEELKQINPDVIVVVAYGLILPRAVLEIPPHGCINIHASLLPRWRGAAPIHRALLTGDTMTGVTTMLMDEGLDTGDILLEAPVPIHPTDTLKNLHDRLSHLGGELIVQTLDQLEMIKPKKQPETGVTYAHKIKKEEGLIDWSQPAALIERQIRALNPWPGTYTYYKNHLLKIQAVERVDATGIPGEILDDSFLVACQDAALRVLQVQRSGSKPMKSKDFLNGIPIKAGEFLSSCPDTN